MGIGRTGVIAVALALSTAAGCEMKVLGFAQASLDLVFHGVEAERLPTHEAPVPVVGADEVRVVPDRVAPPHPSPGQELNDLVVARIGGYPTDGHFPFHWPGPNWRGAWAGTTHDVIYRGEVVAPADAEHRTYCCGVTFEVALGALTDAYAGPVPGLSALDVFRLRLGFCGDDRTYEPERLVVDALQGQGLGSTIAEDDARAGDFVQFWRRDGSGHSAVFMDWLYNDYGERIGLRYWSSQEPTGGVGYHAEHFIGKHGVDRNRLYLARLHAPYGDRADDEEV